MAEIQPMPELDLPVEALSEYGRVWTANGGALSRTPPLSSLDLGNWFNASVGDSLAAFLGGIPIVKPNSRALMPSVPDCVEVGEVRIVGGIRPQNFDVGYRPDGVRFACDSKTLNDTKSVAKNWQNMVNDLATEAATVHSRFPLAVVGFVVAIPRPCLPDKRLLQIISRLEGLARRVNANDPDYFAEALALVVWDPETGAIDPDIPARSSRLRYENFSVVVEDRYLDRYGGLPPH